MFGFTLLLLGLLMVGCRKQAHVSIMKFGPAPGAPHLEYRATVRALPDFHEEKTYSLLRLPAIEGRSIEIVCDPSFSPWLTGLPRERELTFTVWQTKRVSWHTDDGKEEFSWESEIETIKDGPTLIYDAAICPLHKVRMKRCEIDISHGLPMKEFIDAYKGFSGGPGFELAGCVSMAGEPTTKFGYKCERCVAAYECWSADWKAERTKAASAAQNHRPE